MPYLLFFLSSICSLNIFLYYFYRENKFLAQGTDAHRTKVSSDMKILWKDLVMDLAVALVKLTGGHCIFSTARKSPSASTCIFT